MLNNVQILIQNGDKIYEPVVEEGVEWETERKGVPGKLTFNVIKDNVIDFQEGNPVRLSVDGTNIFYGFVFTKKRDKNGIISVTAYDQLRYLKNKDTYVYQNKSAADVIRLLAADFRLQVGVIEDTAYTIEKRIEDNKTLFDIIQTALDITLQNKKKLYVLYDDFGKLTLKDVESMKLNLLIDADTAENFSYTSSINSNTYNKIKLSFENKDEGKRDIYITQDSAKMNEWGVLQFYETIDENCNGKAKADALIQLYNKKTRNLTIDNAFGDLRVRAGTSVVIKLDLGDVSVQNYMLVEKAKHVFKNKEHMMNLTVRGGEFVG